ncbi:hypothetical protein GB937_000266 [Aspergillus fischeri]|nr:hypothetical protein GB937_000266 [Aspergillus fischeri]
MHPVFPIRRFQQRSGEGAQAEEVLCAAAAYRSSSGWGDRITHPVPVAPGLEDIVHIAPLCAEAG